MFITLEGIEGSGKTTQIGHMAEYLRSRGFDCVTTREPGGTKIGEKIRSILLDPASKNISPEAELLLYTADRAQHAKELLNPLLASGKTVICDRYFDATVVYQGFARGLDIDLIRELHALIVKDLKPDVTILLDLPPEVGLSRAWKQIDTGTRTDFETRFEKETLSFHHRVRAGYLELSRQEPERFRVVDASQSEDLVRKDIIDILSLF